MTHPSVLTHIDDRGVATVTLNNPDRHNVFDDAIIVALHDIFTQLDTSDVRAVILAAQGKSFSAGADLSWMQRIANYSYDENLRDAEALARMLQQLNALSKPTIARVQGPALGGGVGLISCCDIAIGTPDASFALSEVKLGLAPATIGPYVINAIGARAARRYFLTAERFSAEIAKNLGLLSEVVAPDALDTTIEALLTALLNNSPQAVGVTKQLIREIADQPVTDELIQHTSQVIADLRVSPEGQEGLAAFLGKRSPRWRKEPDKD